MFFLVIHPVLIVFDETLAQNSSSAEPRICVRNSVLLGRMEPNQVSTVIGGVFTEYNILFFILKVQAPSARAGEAEEDQVRPSYRDHYARRQRKYGA